MFQRKTNNNSLLYHWEVPTAKEKKPQERQSLERNGRGEWMERWSCTCRSNGITLTLYRMCLSRLFSCSPQRMSTNRICSRGENGKRHRITNKGVIGNTIGPAIYPVNIIKLQCRTPEHNILQNFICPNTIQPKTQTKIPLHSTTRSTNRVSGKSWAVKSRAIRGAAVAVHQGVCVYVCAWGGLATATCQDGWHLLCCPHRWW